MTMMVSAERFSAAAAKSAGRGEDHLLVSGKCGIATMAAGSCRLRPGFAISSCAIPAREFARYVEQQGRRS